MELDKQDDDKYINKILLIHDYEPMKQMLH